MRTGQQLFFPPFQLDLVKRWLLRGEKPLHVRSQNFDVLCYLAERAGQVVLREELLKALWPPPPPEGALKQSIYQLREVLGDSSESPRFIETVRGGYKFIAPLKNPSFIPPPASLVGREAELAQLHGWFEKARRGERQMVFVTGEPGIGKTTLVDNFVAQLADEPNLWIGRGQCIEHYGEGEAYLPVLEVLGRLGRQSSVDRLTAFLGQYAPTWLAQLPALVNEEKQEALQRKVQGSTQQRMLREFVEAVEIFTSGEENQNPPILVVVVEDLQWSDYSTLDLIASLSRRRERARLFFIGTYRPAEGLTEGHPLRAVTQELRGHRQCQELSLTLLRQEAVEQYLERRFPTGTLPPRLAPILSRLTEGNPLFLVAVVDDLVDRGFIVQEKGRWMSQSGREDITAEVPESIRQLVSRQIERASAEEQRLLESASVAGLEFSAAAVAAATESNVTEVEARCETFVRRQYFLHRAGRSEWPDGRLTARYGFQHALYQYLWQERVPPNQWQQFHLRIGEQQESVYGSRAGEIAAELAVHFEEGRDYQRALRYRQQAAENAIHRYAPQEAITHLTKALEALDFLPDLPDRLQHELALRSTMGISLQAIRGYGNPVVEQAYTRARELCQQVREPAQLFRVLFGLWQLHLVRAEYQTAHELGEQLLNLTQSAHDIGLVVEAHGAVGVTLFHLGDIVTALTHLEQTTTLYDPQKHRSHAHIYSQDPWVACRSYAGQALWLLGYPDQALQRVQEAWRYAQELAHPFSQAFALHDVTLIYQLHHNLPAVQQHVERLLTLAREQCFPFWELAATSIRGWVLAEQGQGQESLAQMRQGSSLRQAINSALRVPYYLVRLAELYGKVGQSEAALAQVGKALGVIAITGERWWEAEIHRLKGELTLRSAKAKGSTSQTHNEAEQCFLQAIELAQRQQAKSLELRAAISLFRLWKEQGKKVKARRMLAEIYGWFTEGLETADLQEAKALLR